MSLCTIRYHMFELCNVTYDFEHLSFAMLSSVIDVVFFVYRMFISALLEPASSVQGCIMIHYVLLQCALTGCFMQISLHGKILNLFNEDIASFMCKILKLF